LIEIDPDDCKRHNSPIMTRIGQSTIDPLEAKKFGQLAEDWWDEQGPMRSLHQINPLRIGYIRKMIMAHFPKIADLHLLDAGCGAGIACEPMARLGADVTGIDAAKENITAAEAHAGLMGLDIDYRCMAVEELAEERPESFDVILSLEVMEHVANLPGYIKGLERLLKPQGLLIFSTPIRNLLSWLTLIVLAEHVTGLIPKGTHDWDKFLRREDLEPLFSAHGLMLIDLRGVRFSILSRDFCISDNLRINKTGPGINMTGPDINMIGTARTKR